LSITVSSQNAFHAYNLLKSQKLKEEKAQLRLATQKKINSVADDTSGYNVGKSLESKMAVQNGQLNNAQSAIDYLSTAESGLNQVSELLSSISAKANDAEDPAKDRGNIAADINALAAEVDNIMKSTRVAGRNVLAKTDGTSLPADDKFDIGTTNYIVDFAGSAYLKADDLRDAIHGASSLPAYGYSGSVVDNVYGPSSTVINNTGSAITTNLLFTLSDNSTIDVPITIQNGWDMEDLFDNVMVTCGTTAGLDSPIANVNVPKASMTMSLSNHSLSISSIQSTGPMDIASLMGLTSSTGGIDTGGMLSADTETAIAAASNISTLKDNVYSALGRIGNLKQTAEVQSDYLTTSINNMNSSVSKLFDADMAEEQVNASKLAIGTQLGTSMLKQLSIAPQQILTLFQ
jgi:flagellin